MTATDTTVDGGGDLAARQAAAIEASGWGERFRLFQPRNALFWVYLWATVVGVGHTLRYFGPDVANYGGALVASGIAFAIYAAVWIGFLGRVDRYTPEAPKLLAAAFAWGFFAASATLAITVNGAVLNLYAKLFGQAWAADWSAGLTAPFTEEASKALGFVVLLGLAPRLIRSAYDAFVVGAFIGLGFQIWENVLYGYQNAQQDFGTSEPAFTIQIIVVRSLSGLASHTLFSAIFCTGLFWVLGRGAEPRRLGRGLGLIVLAMLCHGVWDSLGAIGAAITPSGTATTFLMPVFIVGEVAIVLWVARLASSTERTWMHDLLAPEVANGTLTSDEVDAMVGSHHQRRKHLKAIHGHHERTVAKHVLAGAHDLAEAIARGHGPDDPAVAFARGEVTRLRAG